MKSMGGKEKTMPYATAAACVGMPFSKKPLTDALRTFQ
jgi:hypothetical protein